jgi:integrase
LPSDSLESESGPHISSHGHSGAELTRQSLAARISRKGNCNVRLGAIASAAKVRAPGKSYVDLERGLYYRKPIGKKATKKRPPPAPLPPRLLAHMRRWDRLGIAKEHNGMPVLSVKKAFRAVVREAKIDLSAGPVTPHTMRHTAATWLMQRGVNLWTPAAGYLGTTVKVLERIYGHHHPEHLAEAVEGITSKQAKKKALG